MSVRMSTTSRAQTSLRRQRILTPLPSLCEGLGGPGRARARMQLPSPSHVNEYKYKHAVAFSILTRTRTTRGSTKTNTGTSTPGLSIPCKSRKLVSFSPPLEFLSRIPNRVDASCNNPLSFSCLQSPYRAADPFDGNYLERAIVIRQYYPPCSHVIVNERNFPAFDESDIVLAVAFERLGFVPITALQSRNVQNQKELDLAKTNMSCQWTIPVTTRLARLLVLDVVGASVFP